MADPITLLNVDGIDIEIMDYDFSKKELDLDSGRNLNGKMDRNVLPHHPRTIDFTLPPKTRNEMSEVLRVLDKSTLTVKAFDIFKNKIDTIEMMHGDLNPSLYWNPDEMLYKNMKVQLVEY